MLALHLKDMILKRGLTTECKGTTKNAHTQVNEHFFRKDRFIYRQCYFTAHREFTHRWVVERTPSVAPEESPL